MRRVTPQPPRGPRWLRQWLSASVASLMFVVVSAAGTPPASASPSATSKWDGGTTLVSGSGGVTTVSCASATFCVAGDLTGAVSTYYGSAWSSPLSVDATHSIASISCPSSTFCVATDQNGEYITWSNGSWSQPAAFSPSSSTMVAVSCATTNFCMAVGHSATYGPSDFYYVNGTWYPDTTAFAASDMFAWTAVSCTVSLVCWATDQRGGVMQFNYQAAPVSGLQHAAAPTLIDPIDATYVGQSISCVTPSNCVVGSTSNQVSTLNAGVWSTAALFTTTSLGVLVSCAQSTCVANDSLGQAVSAVVPFTTWSGVGQLSALSQITSLSCFAENLTVACLAVDNDGFSISLTLGSQGVPLYQVASSVFDAPHTLTSLTCASATYCVASDAAGEVLTYRAGLWSAPRVITSTPLGIREIRCAASAHPYRSLRCAAVLGNFSVLELSSYQGRWTPPAVLNIPAYVASCSNSCEYLSPEGRSSGPVRGYLPQLPSSAIVTDVSCAPPGANCVAIDSAGNSYLSERGKWMLGPALTTRGIPWALSCLSPNFCTAVDIEGQAFTFNGHAWSAPRQVTTRGLVGVSCGATYFCVASDLTGGAYIFNGATWAATAPVSSSGALRSLACASASRCVAVDATRAYQFAVTTFATRVAIAAALAGGSVMGRTLVAATVSALTTPTGIVRIVVRDHNSFQGCVAILKRSSDASATAHCRIATRFAGPATISVDFPGSFGFVPSSTSRLETLHLP